MPMLAAHADRIRLNDKLYRTGSRRSNDRRAAARPDAEQQRLLQRPTNGFVRSGSAARPRAKRVWRRSRELSVAAVKVSEHTAGREQRLRGRTRRRAARLVCPRVRDAAAPREGRRAGAGGDKWAFTLPHKPACCPFLYYAKSRDVREADLQGLTSTAATTATKARTTSSFVNRLRPSARGAAPPGLAYSLLCFPMSSTARLARHDRRRLRPAGGDSGHPALARARASGPRWRSFSARTNPGEVFARGTGGTTREAAQEKVRPRRGDSAPLLRAGERAQRHLLPRQPPLRGITFRPDLGAGSTTRASAYGGATTSRQTPLGVPLLRRLSRVTARARARGVATTSSRAMQTASAWLPWCRSSATSPAPWATLRAALAHETETFLHEFGHALHFLFHDVRYRRLAEVEGDSSSCRRRSWRTGPSSPRC